MGAFYYFSLPLSLPLLEISPFLAPGSAVLLLVSI